MARSAALRKVETDLRRVRCAMYEDSSTMEIPSLATMGYLGTITNTPWILTERATLNDKTHKHMNHLITLMEKYKNYDPKGIRNKISKGIETLTADLPFCDSSMEPGNIYDTDPDFSPENTASLFSYNPFSPLADDSDNDWATQRLTSSDHFTKDKVAYDGRYACESFRRSEVGEHRRTM